MRAAGTRGPVASGAPAVEMRKVTDAMGASVVGLKGMATWRKGTLAAFAVSSSAPVGGVLPQESRTEVFQIAWSGPGPTGTVGGFPGQAKTGGTLALARASPRSSRSLGTVKSWTTTGGAVSSRQGRRRWRSPEGQPLAGVPGLVDRPDVEVGVGADRHA